MPQVSSKRRRPTLSTCRWVLVSELGPFSPFVHCVFGGMSTQARSRGRGSQAEAGGSYPSVQSPLQHLLTSWDPQNQNQQLFSEGSVRHHETFKCPSQPARSRSQPGGCLGCVSGQWRSQCVTLWDSVDPNITGPLTFGLLFPGFRAAEDAGDGGDGSLPLLTTVPQARASPRAQSLLPTDLIPEASPWFLSRGCEVLPTGCFRGPCGRCWGALGCPRSLSRHSSGWHFRQGPCTRPLAVSFLRSHLGSFLPVTLNWEPCWGVQGTFSPRDHQTTRRGVPIPQQEVD